MPTRYLSRSFFSKSCIPSVEVIQHYELDKLVYCRHSINIDLCVEFYNNLIRIDDLTYSTRVCGRDIILTPALLRDYLGLQHSSCSFVCFPPRELPFSDPYSHIILDTMYSYFFGEERTTTVSQFNSTRLRVQDYVLYRVIVKCILPLSTKDVAMMRPFHSFLLYAFSHKLDIDISFFMFHSIIYYFRIIISGRIHMLYCHILTSLLAALEFDVTSGNVKQLIKYDIIGHRQFALAMIELDNNDVLSWKSDEEMSDLDVIDLPSFLTLSSPPVAPALEERVFKLEEK